jgi:hypothetical protein
LIALILYVARSPEVLQAVQAQSPMPFVRLYYWLLVYRRRPFPLQIAGLVSACRHRGDHNDIDHLDLNCAV